MMLLFFGLAHLCYIWLFWRRIPVRRVPAVGARVRAVVGRHCCAVLWPNLGALLIAGRAVRPRPRRHGGRGIPLSPAHREGRRVLPRVRHDPGVPPVHARRDARLDEPARHAHVLPRPGPHRRRCRSSPTACSTRARQPRNRRVEAVTDGLGPRRCVALGGPRLQDPLRGDDCMPRGACTGQRRPRQGRAARATGRRTAGADRRVRPDPRRASSRSPSASAPSSPPRRSRTSTPPPPPRELTRLRPDARPRRRPADQARAARHRQAARPRRRRASSPQAAGRAASACRARRHRHPSPVARARGRS